MVASSLKGWSIASAETGVLGARLGVDTEHLVRVSVMCTPEMCAAVPVAVLACSHMNIVEIHVKSSHRVHGASTHAQVARKPQWVPVKLLR